MQKPKFLTKNIPVFLYDYFFLTVSTFTHCFTCFYIIIEKTFFRFVPALPIMFA